MQCSKCGFDNPEGMKFCGQCGHGLAGCPGCGFENPPGFAFCGQCGKALQETPASSSPPSAEGRTAQTTGVAERRHLTVMFCDLVGSTVLSGHLDPEELRELIRAYQQICADVVRRYEGHIAQYLGDGVLVYFGYPSAHEDDVPRAVHSALEILERMAEFNRATERSHEQKLSVRIGVHSGLVVVGEMGGGTSLENLALGDTPNIAARVQSLAEPDTVLITAASYRLTGGSFECRSIGPCQLKGVSRSIEVYRVIGRSTTRQRMAGPATRQTALVGREREMRLLRRAWDQALSGSGRVVLLSGEAGIGKSRLVKALKDEVAAAGGRILECFCSPYHQNSMLHPVIDLMQRMLRLRHEETASEKLARLEELLASQGLPLQELMPPIAALLSLPLPDGYPPLHPNPQVQKQQRLDALLSWILESAHLGPTWFLVEDLHWVDPSTLELLSLLVERAPAAPILMVLTFRPEFEPPWAAPLSSIMLNRLSGEQAARVIEAVTGGKSFPVELVRQVVAKTDGVPLFVEELTKMVMESGLVQEREHVYELVGPPTELAIPSTLHDSLMARLDRLASIKELAQLAATIGRSFTYELIRALSPFGEPALAQELTRLVEAELLYQRDMPPKARYIFRHALIQDVAYQSLLKSSRQRYHEQIATTLEERFPDVVETQPELVAHHATEAGLVDQAMKYWRLAGMRAIERSANVEAIEHLTKELELLASQPATPARREQELSLQMALGPALMGVKGWSAPEVEKAYGRARELCKELGDPSQIFRVLRGLWNFYYVRGELETSWDLGRELLSLAEDVGDQGFLIEANRSLGAVLFQFGRLAESLEHFERALELYDPREHADHAFTYGQDPGVIGRSLAALTLWQLGYPERALETSQEALELARETHHWFSLAYAEAMAAQLHFYRRDPQAARGHAEATIAISTENAFTVSLAWGSIFQGWALAEMGEGDRGITLMQRGLTSYGKAGGKVGQTIFLAPLIEGYAAHRQPEEAASVLSQCLEWVASSGERVIEAEIHRLRGDNLLAQARTGDPGQERTRQAEACYRLALDVACELGAKSLELRAAVSLGKLLERQGQGEEARRRVTAVYDTFTEGFDTRDLVEARSLMRTLEPIPVASEESGA